MSVLLQGCKYHIYKHFFERNSFSFYFNKDLYELVKHKENFIKYIHYEYSVGIIYNIMMSISILLFISHCFSSIFDYDKISTVWLIFISFIKLVETVPKLILLCQINRILKRSTLDDNIYMRILMKIINSNIFFYNTVLSHLQLLSYSSYLLFYKWNLKSSEKFPQIYLNINLLMYCFFFRILITLINYHFHFKYGINQADLASIDPFAEPQKVKKEVLDMIMGYHLDKQNTLALNKELEGCCICLNEYREGEFVKILPCNSRHVFHKGCIERWLSNNIACPTCRKIVND